ncbi:hypothetical protein ACGFJ7_29475 [Actinoplanes sp. NPDC048988]|uniref:hypothetical protein n=1 Tax=Actinoplanes sp. NPDC048988 TaxID=3363901 RepID=UPI00371EA097
MTGASARESRWRPAQPTSDRPTPGSYLNGADQIAYSVAKAADDRMVAVTAAQPAARDGTVVGVYPGLLRTEGVLRTAGFFDLPTRSPPSSPAARSPPWLEPLLFPAE